MTVTMSTCAYCIIALYMNLAALVRVGIGLEYVEIWKQRFVSICESYNLRQFWG